MGYESLNREQLIEEIHRLNSRIENLVELEAKHEELERIFSSRLRYEEGLAAFSEALLVNAENTIERALCHLLRASDVSRIYVFENFEEDGKLYTKQIYESCAEGISHQIENPALQKLAYDEDFQRWEKNLSQNRPIAGIVENFPKKERDILEPQDVLSVLVLPIWVRDQWYGFIGFDDTEKKRKWNHSDIRLLQTVADTLGYYIERKMNEKELNLYQEKLEEMVEARTAELSETNEQLKREIKERKKLQEVSFKLKKAIETVKVGVTITDSNGKIVYTNPADARAHGYTVEELVGNHVSILGKSQRKKSSREKLRRAGNWKRESVNVRKDGSTFPAQLTSTSIVDNEGKFMGMVTVCEDISERKKAEKELNEAYEKLSQMVKDLEKLNYEKSEFLQIAAHDLKNPLGVILGNVQLLHEYGIENFSKEEIEELFVNIEENCNRMIELIRNLLDVDAIESGNMKIEPEEFDFRFTVQSVINNFWEQAQRKDITLNFSIPEEKYPAFGDVELITQILENLVSNAIKYSPLGKNVYIKISKKGKKAQFEIEDEGLGFTEEDMEKIFGKFARLSAQPTGGEISTGLGLSIVKKLVEAMGGEVWLKNKGENLGAKFTVNLPIIENNGD